MFTIPKEPSEKLLSIIKKSEIEKLLLIKITWVFLKYDYLSMICLKFKMEN